MKPVRFDAELIEGHKGLTAVIVPFNPEVVFARKPARLDPRRDGWLVRGKANGARFEGYIGNRWGRFFILIGPQVRAAAKLEVGDTVTIEVEPVSDAGALATAREQSKQTTAPKRGRADSIDPDAASATRSKPASKSKPAIKSKSKSKPASRSKPAKRSRARK